MIFGFESLQCHFYTDVLWIFQFISIFQTLMYTFFFYVQLYIFNIRYLFFCCVQFFYFLYLLITLIVSFIFVLLQNMNY